MKNLLSGLVVISSLFTFCALWELCTKLQDCYLWLSVIGCFFTMLFLLAFIGYNSKKR